MSRLISRAEAWEKTYEAFTQINFTAFDFYSIKQSIIDYIRLYFPESFNDFIESSEFVAIVEAFAYIGELLIYRVDVGSHENFMSVAQRKQSVLRLAKLISYKATRNIPARGLLKITSVSTTQALFDTHGNALSGRIVSWNDIQNVLWKEQFTTILNAASTSNIGSVVPTERVQVDNVLFELYSLNSVYTTRGVIPYNINVAGNTYPMEVVPVKLDQYGPSERRPEKGSSLTFLYGADGFGNDSPTTGFFLFTKQGKLSSLQTAFDGKTPNQYLDLQATNINDTDIWVNNVDPNTGLIISNGDRAKVRSGEWAEVDTTSAQNVIFSYTSGKNRFEVETLEDDKLRIVFGDGEFANIPAGTFDIWYRSSANENLIIPQNAIVDQSFAIDYIDAQGQRQTLTITASLISNVQNASQSEDIDHIRRVAPATYYTQNRMVSGADYNLFPLKDPSILKLRAVNRTYVGESKFSHWHDASETYENVKIAGDDLVVMLDDRNKVIMVNDVAEDKLLANFIAPALSSNELYTYLRAHHVVDVRKAFNDLEKSIITSTLKALIAPSSLWIDYNQATDTYEVATDVPKYSIFEIRRTLSGWTVNYMTARIIVESPTTNFWSINNNSVVSADTLTAQYDVITILKANESKFGTLLSSNITMDASSMVLDETGMQNINKLEVVAYDSTSSMQQGLSILSELVDPIYNINADSTYVTDSVVRMPTILGAPSATPTVITLPFDYVRGMDEFVITGLVPSTFNALGAYVRGDWEENPDAAIGSITNTINLYANVRYDLTATTSCALQVVQYSLLYQYRSDGSQPYTQTTTTDAVRLAYANQVIAGIPTAIRTYDRVRGVKNVNFLWKHTAPQYHLIDPSFTNINDVFIIQRGYYANYLNWLDNLVSEPALPTPLQLRNDYQQLLASSMLSDTVVFHPGKLRLIIGNRAIPELQATVLVVKNVNSSLTDSQIKSKVKDLTRSFFDVSFWEFGATFYFTELVAVIHHEMAADINSVVLVPLSPNHFFGDLFQVNIQEDEIVQADINLSDIEVVSSLSALRINQFG